MDRITNKRIIKFYSVNLVVVFIYSLILSLVLRLVFDNSFFVNVSISWLFLFSFVSAGFIYLYPKFKDVQLMVILFFAILFVFTDILFLNVIGVAALIFMPFFFTKFRNKFIFATLSSILLFIIYVVSVNLSEPEEYLLIVLIFLLTYSYGLIILLSLVKAHSVNEKSEKIGKVLFIISILIIFGVIFVINIYSNMLAVGLTSEYYNRSSYVCVNVFSFNYSSNLPLLEVAEFLYTLKDKVDDPTIFAQLALLEQNETYAFTYLDKLDNEITTKKFENTPLTSNDWNQYLFSTRLYYLYLLRNKFSSVREINQSLIDSYFSEKVHFLLDDTLSSNYFRFYYKRDVGGFYQNQENGMGLIAIYLLNYPNDSRVEELNSLFIENARGWKDSWKNFDDSIYYQNIWIQNAYFMCLYNSSYCDEGNIKRSFDFIYDIYNGNMSSISFNSISTASYPNLFSLGFGLTEDTKYIYTRDEMFKDILNYNFIDSPNLIGIESWIDYNKTFSVSDQSCVIFSSAGIPGVKEEIMPDKAILRNSQGDYVLVNLRSSGWHRYKGTGGIYFLTENGAVEISHYSNTQSFSFLPSGRALNRDLKLRKELFSSNVTKDQTIYGAISNLFGLGSRFDQRTESFVENLTFDLNKNSVSFFVDGKNKVIALK